MTYIFIKDKNGNQIYPSTENEREVINDLKNKKYRERTVEVTTGGEYLTAEDGTQISVGQIKTKIYIFYTEYVEN